MATFSYMIKEVEIAAERAKGITNLAKQMGITHNAFYSWKRIPAGRVLTIEAITGLSRHYQRPDLYGHGPMWVEGSEPTSMREESE